MFKIFLLEDDKILAQELSSSLEKEGFKVSSTAYIEEAKKFLSKEIIDLSIIDLNLMDGSGFSVLPLVKNLPTIVVTAMNTPENRLKAIELGSYDFISKPFFFKELLLKIKQLLRITENSEKIILPNNIQIDLLAREIKKEGKAIFLSDREYRMLKLLIEKSPEVITREDVLAKICDPDEFPTERIVDNCVLKLRSALNDKNHEIIRSVRGVGYQWLLVKE